LSPEIDKSEPSVDAILINLHVLYYTKSNMQTRRITVRRSKFNSRATVTSELTYRLQNITCAYTVIEH